jgi:hypothetical protein
MSSQHVPDLTPLPLGISVEQIYADLLQYLFRHTKTYFEEKEFGGKQTWRKLAASKCINFVIAHPCGWGLLEQSMLRRVTVRAGLVGSLQLAKDQVQFVAEAEASAHFVTIHADLGSRLQVSTTVPC